MADYNDVNSSGKYDSFEGGAVRDAGEGKGRFDLIPYWGLFRLARHYENGCKKYEENNWKKGIPQSRYFSSAIRHLYRYWAGDRSEDHLAAAAWNIFALIDQEERMSRGTLDKKFDDTPTFKDYDANSEPRK